MLDMITKQIIQFNPQMIYLFGSQARGSATEASDIDLCVIAPTDNKRQFVTQLYYMIDSEKPIDFLVYTPEEWNRCISDNTSFAYKIVNEGVKLYG